MNSKQEDFQLTYFNKPYCTYCGRQMTATPIFLHFDAKTGERLYKIQFKCPNKHWWNLHDAGFLGDKPAGYSVLTEREL